jgi:hypothetical protein
MNSTRRNNELPSLKKIYYFSQFGKHTPTITDKGQKMVEEIETFLENWPGAHQPMRDSFRLLYRELSAMPDVTCSFNARPGVSYSLRPHRNKFAEREFFAIVDVIDDEPENRWLSVCFYKDMIGDPEERGECIPGGLAGSDGYCFNLQGEDNELTGYVIARLHEAWAAAARC